MKLQLPKGIKDIGPEDKILRDSIVEKLKIVFEKFGFNPIETPTIERFDVLAAKFGAGKESESLKETFKLRDQGKRELGLRFEFTTSLARYIAMNSQIKMPFKRYQIGNVFRDGPIKLGRTREFIQCDVDIVGSKDSIADAECVKLALAVFDELKIDAFLRINNRKIIDSVLNLYKVSNENKRKVIVAIDKLDKISKLEAKKEIKKYTKNYEEILKVISITGNNNEKIKKFEELKIDNEGINEIKEILTFVRDERVIFDPTLMRGFGYYTGPVFEGYLKNSKVKSSICGGGRWDNMIGNFIGKGSIPATGISFGLEPITEFFRESSKRRKSFVSVYVIPINTQEKSYSLLDLIRKNGINGDIDLLGRSLSRNLEYVNSLEIPIVIIAGERDLKENMVTIRDMIGGKEFRINLNEVIDKLKELL